MTHWLTTQVLHHGYLAVFVLMVLESACIPIPSEVIMLFGGALAGGLLAAGHPSVNLVGVALWGALGNLLGALIAYGVGRIGGRPVVERYGRYVFVRRHHLEKAEAFFARRGALAVLIGRVLPVVRTFISLPAGVAEMPIAQFSLFTLLGSLPWTFALAGAGYGLAANWSSVASAFGDVSIAIGVLAVGAIGWWLLRPRRAQALEQTSSRAG
jgi:membrane protein DedA with SNARE-associated domain